MREEKQEKMSENNSISRRRDKETEGADGRRGRGGGGSEGRVPIKLMTSAS